jgi:hypothetical protein
MHILEILSKIFMLSNNNEINKLLRDYLINFIIITKAVSIYPGIAGEDETRKKRGTR